MKKPAPDFNSLSAFLTNPDDGTSVIQQEFENFLDAKRVKRQRLLQQLLMLVAGFVVFALAYCFVPRIWCGAAQRLAYLRTARYEQSLNENALEIRVAALAQLPARPFQDYQFGAETTDPLTRYAILIHQYATDFYSRSYAPGPADEIRLLAYVKHHGFHSLDLCALNHAFIEDSTLLVRDWLLERTNDPQNPYFNPVVRELRMTTELYKQQLEQELQRPFAEQYIGEFRRDLADSGHRVRSDSLLQERTVRFLVSHPQYLERARFYRRKIHECEQELNLRLGLLMGAIGKEYGVRGSREYYGWMQAAYRGKSWFRNRQAPREYEQLYSRLHKEARRYYQEIETVEQFYNGLDFQQYSPRIENPIRIGLMVKDVGLFGVLRRNNQGLRYSHRGIDLMAEEGTAVYPIMDGFVFFVGNDGSGHGNRVEIWHDHQLVSRYSHLAKDEFYLESRRRFTEEGPFLVTRGKRIASVGTSGNIPEGDPQYGYSHLHLEIRQDGVLKNPFLLFHEKIVVIH